MAQIATNSSSTTTNSRTYFPVLDALRFVLAFWVAIGHYKMLPLFVDPRSGPLGWTLIKRFYETIVFGTPAVIVFFVISGFCIHLPFCGSTKIDIGRYYLRRYTRILIPVAGALAVYRLTGQAFVFRGEHSILWESPLWSLACEEIYYAAYPLLRWTRNRFGWVLVLSVVFPLSALISRRHPAGGWLEFGPFGTAVILLPVWLLGCLLAEQSEVLPVLRSSSSIWMWRFTVWFGSWCAEMLHFKLHISYVVTMVWFGILAYFWVRQEIRYAKIHSPNPWLVAGGAWSYSLYLVHSQGGRIIELLSIPTFGRIVDWGLVMTGALGFSYIFYLLVERPSHNLARKFKVQRAVRVTCRAESNLEQSVSEPALQKRTVDL